MILEWTLVSFSLRESAAVYDGGGFDEGGVGSFLLQDDGNFAEEDQEFGEEGREVMLQGCEKS